MGSDSIKHCRRVFTVRSTSTTFKLLAVLTGSTVVLTACSTDQQTVEDTATTTNTQTEAKEVDPVYGEKNGLDLIELQDSKPEVAEVVVDNEP